MNFMRFKWLYFLLSGLVIIPGLYSLVRWGLRPSIDFTGGTLIEYRTTANIPQLSEKVTKTFTDSGYPLTFIQKTADKQVLLKLKPIDQTAKIKLDTDLEKALGEKPQQLRFETVGPVLGQELVRKTGFAVAISAIFILAWVWHQFRNPMFGICAILAMLHDLLVLLGIFSLLGHFLGVEIDSLFVTAVLTILSFSVHDTVVVYDRIRESEKFHQSVPFVDLVNKAVTETLSRSINNSFTIILVLTSLYLIGGTTTRWFSLALLVGAISGTYSSTFTAVPLLVVWKNLKSRR